MQHVPVTVKVKHVLTQKHLGLWYVVMHVVKIDSRHRFAEKLTHIIMIMNESKKLSLGTKQGTPH